MNSRAPAKTICRRSPRRRISKRRCGSSPRCWKTREQRRRDMADRNSIIEKIKALLAKATANGATEAEMLAALDKAAAMRDAYDITDEELQVAKDEVAMLRADPPDLKDPHKIKWRLTYAVGQFCGVQIFRSRHETGLKCIGMPSDV